MFLKIITCLLLLIKLNEAAKILFLYPALVKAHIMPIQTLSLEMAERGHEVTFLTTFPLDPKIKNYREIRIPIDENDFAFFKDMAKTPKGIDGILDVAKIVPKMLRLIYELGDELLKSKTMENLKKEKFDAIIIGYMMNDFLLGLGDHFKCPTIYFIPAPMQATVIEMVGNPMGLNGFPHILYGGKIMDFTGRVLTFLFAGLEIGMNQVFKYKSKQVYDKNFPSDQYRSYEESLRNVSLVIQNSHFSFSYPRPLLPNMVEAGGLQVKSKPSPLPVDLKNFLDKANDGAILFTLGSILKSNELPKSTVEILLKVFGKIKQRIVMKWESDELPGKPQNVFISKWLPQDDVLAHPNIKAFISHCGPNGIYEARYNSVPIIGIPHFAEHLGYLRLIVQEGWAIELDQDTLIEEILENAIKEILTNPKYLQIVQKSSTLVKDRPLNAQDTAAFWVEYVIRHHGAPHLHYPGADQNLLQKNSIDVIAFILAIIYAVFKVFKLIFKRLCCHKKSNISVKEKRN